MSKLLSKSFGAQKAQRPHLVMPGGGVAGEVNDLRRDANQGFMVCEARTGFPELDWVDGAGPLVAGGDIVLKGRNLLQSTTFDTLTVGTGTAALTFTMLAPGNSGYSLKIVDAGSLSVTVASEVVTVNVNAGTTTAAQVATEFNKAGGTMKGVMRCNDDGVTGAGTPAAAAAADLTGGVGLWSGFYCKVAGVACAPKHATGTAPAQVWTDTAVTITVPALTGKVATDKVAIELACDGIQCKAVSSDCGETVAATAAIAAMDQAYKAADAIIRKRTSWPELDWIDGGAFAAAGGDVVLKGRNLLGSKTFDTLTVGTGTAELVFTMLKPGDSEYTLEIVDAGALSVALATKKVTVNIDAGTTTADQVATEFNKSGATMKGVMRCVSGGVGTPAAAVEAALTGGLGNYNEEAVTVGGVACLPAHATGTTPAATWADTQVTVTVPNLTGSGLAASDIAGVVAKASSIHTQQLSVVLT